MSQNYTGSISLYDEENSIIKVPHIVKNGYLYIAFEYNELEKFIFEALRSWKTDIHDYENYDFIDVLIANNISDCIIYHESDWADIPIDDIEFAIKNKEVVLETISFNSYERNLNLVDIQDPFIEIPKNKINPYDFLTIDKKDLLCWRNYNDFLDEYNIDK